ncbi:MAG: BREX-2 system adenine-specific DNA-methyltransferase PglX, partial [Byssovorax sp.]
MAARKKSEKTTASEIAGQSDPRAPLGSKDLLAAARPVLKLLAEDLLERARASSAVTAALEARHRVEQEQRRTADPFVVWQTNLVDQVAAAWMLSCVFVRTLEDRGLLGGARLAGPGAADSQRQFFELAPSLGERDYLLTVFRELSRFPAAADLFDAKHNPVWLLTPSASAAKALLGLFRLPSPEAPTFRFGQADTRFLGDLYQDLNEVVQKRYALLQTPRFVESFILDRTLEPAIERFGLDETTIIDPTCGSGHFLLGAFDRLYEHRLLKEPALGEREAARKALDAVYGSDINPYAVAIARFRLTLAFLEKAGFTQLAAAPKLPLHLVVADSLLHNAQLAQASFQELEGQSAVAWAGQIYALEDDVAAREILYRRYAAVVGNPPYITVKDKVLRDRYREMYLSAAMQYSLAAPFAQRFFELAKDGGSVGMITANSFMKREFGKKLISEYLPTVNLELIVNTAGAHIPGHGTPTVLLFGTAEAPKGRDILTVLAKRGEPHPPENPEQGLVWRSIDDHWSEVGFENDYLSVARIERKNLTKHPWSLGGGGATDLKLLLEERSNRILDSMIRSIGRVAHTGNDEAFVASSDTLQRRGLHPEHISEFIEGESLRDWGLAPTPATVFPYGRADLKRCTESLDDPRLRWLWPYRAVLWERREPNGTHREIGLTWYEFSRFHPERYVGAGIGFAFVATHNQFVLDLGGKVFNRSAPAIKLPDNATEDDHFALLAYLNSSTACFWMKQVFFDKGNRGEGGGTTSETWEKFFEFDGTKIRELPVPRWSTDEAIVACQFARSLATFARRRQELLGVEDLFESASDSNALARALDERATKVRDIEHQIRALQEELDWWVYATVNLCDPTLTHGKNRLEPGARACDVRFAREVMAGSIGRRYFKLCRLPSPETRRPLPRAGSVGRASTQ